MVFQFQKTALAASVAGLVLGLTPVANAANLKADYNFDGDFSSSVSGAPDLVRIRDDMSHGRHSYFNNRPNLWQLLLEPNESFGTTTIDGQEASVFNYSYGTGLQFFTEGLITDNSEYSVAMRFQFDWKNSWPTYHRLIDSKNLTTDIGLYQYSNGEKLVCYRCSGWYNGFVDVDANGWYDVVMTRDSDKNLNLFIDGQKQVSFVDSSNSMEISSHNSLIFFLDQWYEHTSGSVDRIMVFDGALTDGEVADLDLSIATRNHDPESTPEPTSLLALLGAGIAGWFAKRRS